MGEYARLRKTGERVKIGTCEEMLYLRVDQATQVAPEHGNVDPTQDTEFLLYRFPWPQEDDQEPGGFDVSEPNVALHVQPSEGLDHGHKQWRADGGYLLLTPCPESAHGAELLGFVSTVDAVQHNGYSGPTRIAYQRVWGDRLVLVCKCNGCGRAYRLPALEDVAPVLADLRSRTHSAEWYRMIADRIEAGYQDGAASALGLKPNMTAEAVTS